MRPGITEANRLLRKTALDAYEHLGCVMACSLLWLVFSLPVVTLPASAAGTLFLAKKITDGEKCSVLDFFTGFRRFFWKSSVTFLIAGGLLALFSFNMFFCTSIRNPLGAGGFIIAGFSLWGIALLCLLLCYLLPLTVYRQFNPFSALKEASLLVVDNPVFTLIIFAEFAAWAVACVCLFAPFFVLFGGGTGILLHNALGELRRKYSR